MRLQIAMSWNSSIKRQHCCHLYPRWLCFHLFVCLYLCLFVCLCVSNIIIMASSNGNIFRLTGPSWGEFTGHRWIPLTKTSDVELWYFFWSASEQTTETTMETPVIWDAIAHIIPSLYWWKGGLKDLSWNFQNRRDIAQGTIWAPFYWHGLTLIPAWISNHLPGKVWDEITYPFLNFNGCTVEV